MQYILLIICEEELFIGSIVLCRLTGMEAALVTTLGLMKEQERFESERLENLMKTGARPNSLEERERAGELFSCNLGLTCQAYLC